MAIQQTVFENSIILATHRISREIHGSVTTGWTDESQGIAESG